jgi:adenylyltransferase/sulfurtransferase
MESAAEYTGGGPKVAKLGSKGSGFELSKAISLSLVCRSFQEISMASPSSSPVKPDPSPGSSTPGAVDRYRRQAAFAGLGQAGQAKLAKASVAIVGVGALGSMIAERLGRAGVGKLRLIDRDWVETDNLPRQTLFTEEDADQRLPKAVAAANHLQAVDRRLVVESVIADLVPSNAIELLRGYDLILDGTDNFETRYLINDVAWEENIPWIHGGCIGAHGQGMVCIPGLTACFRCLMPEPLPPDQQATCDSAGVLGPVCRSLITFDLWDNSIRYIRLQPATQGTGCPACHQGRRDFLNGQRFSTAQVLCGRNAVQLHSPRPQTIDLVRLGQRLTGAGQVTVNPFLLRFERVIPGSGPMVITVFRDGRGIVAGTEDPAVARQLFATWIGQ